MDSKNKETRSQSVLEATELQVVSVSLPRPLTKAQTARGTIRQNRKQLVNLVQLVTTVNGDFTKSNN